ncbi:SH3 domain-containing protein [Aureispira anguillae]|uniref:SH3 domain-containing protein n=1 Tax=Aureispira anguillae TaxID=2864201 RepID=A0A916DW77_9BACT|nr:SH3 domain-containing protein [Aureispira anguillae]BDS15171.1 SH3 domain-containing protein [Aureispira anguillae]
MKLSYRDPFCFFLLLCSFLIACTPQENVETTSNENKIIEEKALPRLFMKTQTPHLRVRQTPDLEGAILKVLNKDLIVEYLHDSTTFTTEIVYNRKDYNAHWYKIQTLDKVEGWIYAAFVQFLPKDENQKITIQRETDELLEAANEQMPALTKKQKKEQKQVVSDNLINTYKNYLATLDKNNPNAIAQAIHKYSALFIPHSNQKTHDAAYVEFHNFYIRVLHLLQQKNLGSYQHLATEIKRYQRATMQTDEFTRELAANGFNFALKDGTVVLGEDTDFIYRVFYRECSTPMRAYMNQYQLEEPNFWLANETLLIPPKQLARWTLSWNYFIATYPDFVWYSEAKDRLEKQLNILLQGPQKTPAFNAQSLLLNANYLKAYRHIVDNYPESKIGRAFQEYIDVLKDNDWKKSSEVTQTQNKIMRMLVLE